MQLFCENNQEVIDMILIAYRAAENREVLLPTMVCLDGFLLSHSTEAVMLPSQEEADAYLPPYKNENLRLDVDNPMFINPLCPTSEFSEVRYQQELAFKEARKVLPAAMGEFAQKFGRKYGLIETYKTEDADTVLLGLGSMCGTMKHVVDHYRAEGKKVGMIKVTSFRPFPAREIAEALKNVKNIGVFDRSAGLGDICGPFCADVRAALATYAPGKSASAFLAGLAGRDIRPATIMKAFDMLAEGKTFPETCWIDTNTEAALSLREVK